LYPVISKNKRLAVVGAGAIGTDIAARLARSGADIRLIARGGQRSAIAAGGITVDDGGERWQARLPVFASGAEAGPVDIVVLGVKAHQLEAALPQIEPLLGAQTAIVALQNGIPWWYGFDHPRLPGITLENVDPGGSIARRLGCERAIGAQVYFSANVPAPGVVVHGSGMRIVIGDPAAPGSERIAQVAQLFTAAGYETIVSDRIRAEIWSKLLGNATFNPLTALTRQYIREAYEDPRTLALVRAGMAEVLAVASALGDAPEITIDHRLAISPIHGDIRTSTLQDVEAGRALETRPLIGAIVELAALTGVVTPTLATLDALVSALDRSIGRSSRPSAAQR
jgi:2-dehydropantoate 2-reductase